MSLLNVTEIKSAHSSLSVAIQQQRKDVGVWGVGVGEENSGVMEMQGERGELVPSANEMEPS